MLARASDGSDVGNEEFFFERPPPPGAEIGERPAEASGRPATHAIPFDLGSETREAAEVPVDDSCSDNLVPTARQ